MGNIRINPKERYVMFETTDYQSAMDTTRVFVRMGYDVSITSEEFAFYRKYYIFVFDQERNKS